MTKRKTVVSQAKSQHFKLKKVEPLSKNQGIAFNEYNDGQHLILSGSAGSGKSFLAMYLFLNEMLNEDSFYEKIIIIRSAVPSRDLGFVPGTLEEKSKIYQEPYMNIVNELVCRGDAWQILKQKDVIEFQTTSFLRGLTFKNSLVFFDEFQSATFHEIDTVLTRIGENSRFIFCGDYNQNDLVNKNRETSGFEKASQILSLIKSVSHVKFTIEDIVRSGFVKKYLTAKEKLNV